MVSYTHTEVGYCWYHIREYGLCSAIPVYEEENKAVNKNFTMLGEKKKKSRDKLLSVTWPVSFDKIYCH